MKANELRNIVDSSKIAQAEEFWGKFKDKLFDEMVKKSELGVYSVTISCYDKLGLGPEGCWIGQYHLRNKVMKELEDLDYILSYYNDYGDEYVIIKW